MPLENDTGWAATTSGCMRPSSRSRFDLIWTEATAVLSSASVIDSDEALHSRSFMPGNMCVIPVALAQALRMHVNQERRQMMNGMRAAFKLLKPGGVIAVITWKHSEAALVTEFLRENGQGGDQSLDGAESEASSASYPHSLTDCARTFHRACPSRIPSSRVVGGTAAGVAAPAEKHGPPESARCVSQRAGAQGELEGPQRCAAHLAQGGRSEVRSFCC